MTKQLCLELEVQIKESENAFEQMHSTHAKLKDSYDSLKDSSKNHSADLMKAKSEANELKSLLAYTETKVSIFFTKTFFSSLKVQICFVLVEGSPRKK